MRRRGALASILAAALALAGCAAAPPSAPVRLTVLHTNDHHGRFWRGADGEAGLAARRTIVDAVRAELRAEGGHVLLLDAGDVNTGVPESDLQDAEPDFRGMSALRYDAMAVGNHEFDRGAEVQRRQRTEWSNFPWLSANARQDGRPMFEPHRIFELGGLRVAVLGLTTEDTARMRIDTRYPGVSFEPAIAEAARRVPALRRDADVVIALTHLGHHVDGRHGSAAPGDVELARAVPGIDLVVGGHTHSLVCMLEENRRRETYEPQAPCAPDRQGGAWIVQAGDRGRFVGRIDLEWHDGRLVLRRYRLIPVNLGTGTPVAEDPATLALLDPFVRRAAAALDASFGHAAGRFDGEREQVRGRRNPLGVLVAEAMRQAADADLAVLSSGGLRATLPEGPVTRRGLLTVLPFGNRLVVVTMPGSELRSYLDAVLRMTPGSGAFAQYSGLVLDGATTAGARVGGRPLDPQRSYRLALPSFIAAGGDGYPDLRSHAGYRDTGLIDSALLGDFIAARGRVAPEEFQP
ncbi:MAG TPA: 5'-nucleotidase C-terminal domain-containing protein [Methylibium sp.]|uniref:5'-nucleotidase C-terminal domain-containing protein n=1 Tax=Methylibium sp. TaxID=2067992 RepID=UPI002DB8FE3C|nr:5'-nucleotidase C-terminal domain-containing protein [Methylibium sp.]HEU4460278.1 5'-nucleotidase C-terminal domain-containing protein [Methylibium sp.]